MSEHVKVYDDFAKQLRVPYKLEEIMNDNENAVKATVQNQNHLEALTRNDMAPGRFVALHGIDYGIVVTGTLQSPPYDRHPKKAKPRTGGHVLVRSDESGETREYSLYELGVVPNEHGEWSQLFLLDAHYIKRLPQRRDGIEHHNVFIDNI